MKISCLLLVCLLAFSALVSAESAEHKHHKGKHHKHHKGHHHHKGKHHKKKGHHVASPSAEVKPVAAVVATVAAQTVVAKVTNKDEELVAKMKALELRLHKTKTAQELKAKNGHLLVLGPLPVDFAERFVQAVGQATGTDVTKMTVTSQAAVKEQPGVFAIDFKADPSTVKLVEVQAADSESKLANGNLHSFLVAKDDDSSATDDASSAQSSAGSSDSQLMEKTSVSKASHSSHAAPTEKGNFDIDTAMPYGELEPFGREDTAQELTEDSVTESNSMVDQLERAEVAEEKRAVFRALTRLRGAAITSFDGVARSQTGNIDEYNKIHKWRTTHPLHHLADEESDVSKWAFPDNADF